jgi:hypothetical protein
MFRLFVSPGAVVDRPVADAPRIGLRIVRMMVPQRASGNEPARVDVQPPVQCLEIRAPQFPQQPRGHLGCRLIVGRNSIRLLSGQQRHPPFTRRHFVVMSGKGNRSIYLHHWSPRAFHAARCDATPSTPPPSPLG